MSVKDGDRGRLRLLWIGAGTYFLILLNSLRYFSRTPYQIVILGTAINLAMITAFILAIRKAYMKAGNESQIAVESGTPSIVTRGKPRNVRALWLAAGVYFAAMVIGLQYATRVPYQVLLLAAVLNMAIILTFVVKLRQAYLKPRRQSGT